MFNKNYPKKKKKLVLAKKMEYDEVVYIKVIDQEKGDILFEGKVSASVTPDELVKLSCFMDRGSYVIFNRAANEEVKSFKGLHNAEMLASRCGGCVDFAGVLYVAADGVLRSSKTVPPPYECVMMMSVWSLSQELCGEAFSCLTLEELEIYHGQLKQIPNDIANMKNLKKLRLYALDELKCLPEGMGELSNLRDLWIEWCGIESLPKKLKTMKSIRLEYLNDLQLHAEDVDAFSRLALLKIKWCEKAFSPVLAQAFWEMIKVTTELCFLDLDWHNHKREIVAEALQENGSIVEGGKEGGYDEVFERNKCNHARAMVSAVCVLAIRRWRKSLSFVPREMARMIAMMLWDTRFDLRAWSK